MECGKGTLEVDGVCMAPDDTVTCGPGFAVSGNHCIPEQDWIKNYCDPATTELKGGICVGTASAPPRACTETCPTPAAGKTCLQGQTLEFTSLVLKGTQEATPIAAAAKRYVRVYDPFAFQTSPSPPPLAEVKVGTNGCFIIEELTVPFTGVLAVAVEDDEDANAFARLASGVPAQGGQVIEDMPIPAMTAATATNWGNELVTKGSMMMWLQSEISGANVSGAVPTTAAGAPTADTFFPNATLEAIDTTATATTTSGVALIRSAGLGQYSAKKDGCAIESVLGGSSPGAIFLIRWPVKGCQ